MARGGGRQANGRSSIYVGKDGYWHGRVTVGTKVDGSPDRRHVMARTRAAVTRKVRDLEEAKRSGALAHAGQVWTLERWLLHWLDHVVVTRVRRKSLAAYQSAVTKHLIPGLGQNRLDQLTPDRIEQFYTAMAAQTKPGADGDLRRRYRPATIDQVHRTLRTALQDAMRKGLVGKNPAALASRPASQAAEQSEKEITPFTLEEAKAILRAASLRPNGERAMLALSTGLRQGEVIGLTWDRLDVDSATPEIRVRYQLQRHTWRHGCGDPTLQGAHPCGRKRGTDCPERHSGGLVVTEVKSRSGRRVIALDPTTAARLRQHRERQKAQQNATGIWDPLGFVFAGPRGDPIDPRRDLDEWKGLLRDAGVRESRLHDARHTAATFLLLQGVDARVVMDLMGWSTVSMLKRYQHVLDTLRRDAATRMGGLLYGSPDDPPPPSQ